MPVTPHFASPVDVSTFDEYRIVRDPQDPRPLYRFSGRITRDGSSGFPAVAGRYHLYAGRFCPWAQRVLIERSLQGLEDAIGVSYVDGARDGRGWAFREGTGPDRANGFALLREAYDATEPGFDGHISVPTLWDTVTRRVVSNDFRAIGIDLAVEFADVGCSVPTYAEADREEIEGLDSWIGPRINHGVGAAARDADVRRSLLGAFDRLEELLGAQRFLLGEHLTEADVRLFVTLVRFDVRENATRDIVGGLAAYPNLWAYARELYALEPFRSTTDFDAFALPGAVRPDWDAPLDLERPRAA
jgi:glutathionyl-hydroquinone reductase